MSKVSGYLAHNLRYLRDRKAWSQEYLAQQASIPRTTLTHMESGRGNPSLQNLTRVAQALGVGVEGLLTKPQSESYHIQAADIPRIKRGTVHVYQLLQDAPSGLAIERLVFPPGSSFTGQPHLQGSYEYLIMIQGSLKLQLMEDHYHLEPGDILSFYGHQRHSYQNPGQHTSIAFSVVLQNMSTS